MMASKAPREVHTQHVCSPALEMTQQLMKMMGSSSELKILIEAQRESWYEKVYTKTTTRFKIEHDFVSIIAAIRTQLRLTGN